jgi:hypothetical protein
MIPEPMSHSPLALPTAPVVELERRLRWPALPALAFMAIMLGLVVVALVTSRPRPVPDAGLPDDPELRAARVIVAGRVLPSLGTLRMRSSLLGQGGVPLAFDDVAVEHAARAQAIVTAAHARHATDARVGAALGALAMVQGQHRDAETAYRAALDRHPTFGEARLGLGIALARRAWLAPAPLKPRALELAALAQFLAVPEGDPCYLEALYNSAVLARRVGRQETALQAARAYLLEDRDGPWAERLRGELALIAAN